MEGGLKIFCLHRWSFGRWFNDSRVCLSRARTKTTMKAFSTSFTCVSRARAYNDHPSRRDFWIFVAWRQYIFLLGRKNSLYAGLSVDGLMIAKVFLLRAQTKTTMKAFSTSCTCISRARGYDDHTSRREFWIFVGWRQCDFKLFQFLGSEAIARKIE